MKSLNENSIPLSSTDAAHSPTRKSRGGCSTGTAAELSVCIMETEKCSYCGNPSPFVGENALKKYTKQHRLVLKVPICGRCFLEIKCKRIPATASFEEIKLVEKVNLLKSAASGLSKKTPMHRILALCNDLEEIKTQHCLSLNDFDVKARAAEIAARKVEWLRSTIQEAKDVFEIKLHSTYENCRKVANKCCADPEIRNLVFSRDGGKCVRCGGDENLSVDHIKPVRLGGGNEPENLQTLCVVCNSSKGSKYIQHEATRTLTGETAAQSICH